MLPADALGTQLLRLSKKDLRLGGVFLIRRCFMRVGSRTFKDLSVIRLERCADLPFLSGSSVISKDGEEA